MYSTRYAEIHARTLLQAGFLFLILLNGTVHANDWKVNSAACSRDNLQQCIGIAEPLLRNPNYVFPANKDDLSTVCRTWTNFVDCVQNYANSCVKSERKPELQSALDETMRTVTEMCTNDQYQNNYLQYAPCIKSIAASETKCRGQLTYLVDQVSALSISSTQICCAHHAFRECMFQSISQDCGSGQGGAAVMQFTKNMLSKALAFLLRQCQHYSPSSGDCPTLNEAPSSRTERKDNVNSGTTETATVVSLWNGFTSRPWIPGVDNFIETPKQQGLYSAGAKLAWEAHSICICSAYFLYMYFRF